MQSLQQIADSWRNVIGSSAITIILTFFIQIASLRFSNAERQEFANAYLKNCPFLYQTANGNDVTVSQDSIYIAHNLTGTTEVPWTIPWPFYHPNNGSTFHCSSRCSQHTWSQQ